MLLACRMSSLCSNVNIQVSRREQDGNTTRGDPREIKRGKAKTVRQTLSRTPCNPGPPCFLEPNFRSRGRFFSARGPESRQMQQDIPTLRNEYLTTKEAASYLGVSRQTLEIGRHKGTGPSYCRPIHGRLVRYFRPDLDAWMQGARRQHTAEPSNAGGN